MTRAELPGIIRDWHGTITTGCSRLQTAWPIENRWDLTGAELVDLVNPAAIAPRDRNGSKDGNCFVAGTLELRPGSRGMSSRLKTSVSLISLAVFDFDAGTEFLSLERRLRHAGCAGIIVPTYSHGARVGSFLIGAERWKHHVSHFGSPEKVVLNRLQAMLLPDLAEAGIIGAPRVLPVEGKPSLRKVEFRLAQPWPRWRAILPLAAPWTPAGGAGVKGAAEWARLYHKAASALGFFDCDLSCSDAARPFYSRRTPLGWRSETGVRVNSEPGPQTGVAVLDGKLLDLAALPVKRLTAEDEAVRQRWEANQAAARAAKPPPPGYAGDWHGRKRKDPAWPVQRPDGRVTDLTQWHRRYGHQLMIADWYQERMPELLADRGESEGKVHVLCPCCDDHSSGREDGTFVWNAERRRRGGVFCNHTACNDRGAGEWLHRLIDVGVILWTDLDQIEAAHTAALFASPTAIFDEMFDGPVFAPGGRP
jgi:hypothetical protein